MSTHLSSQRAELLFHVISADFFNLVIRQRRPEPTLWQFADAIDLLGQGQLMW